MSIFEDTFTVSAVDPDGKVFERGNYYYKINSFTEQKTFIFSHLFSFSYFGLNRNLWNEFGLGH